MAQKSHLLKGSNQSFRREFRQNAHPLGCVITVITRFRKRKICEIAAAIARRVELLPDAVVLLKKNCVTAALRCIDRSHAAGSPGTNDDNRF